MGRPLTAEEFIELQAYMHLWDPNLRVGFADRAQLEVAFGSWTSHNVSHLALSPQLLEPPLTSTHLDTVRTLFHQSTRWIHSRRGEYELTDYAPRRAFEELREIIGPRILDGNGIQEPFTPAEIIELETEALVIARSMGLRDFRIRGEGVPPFPANVLALLEHESIRARLVTTELASDVNIDRASARLIAHYVQNQEAFYDVMGTTRESGMNPQQRVLLEWSINRLGTRYNVTLGNEAPLVTQVDGVFHEYPVSDLSIRDAYIAERYMEMSRPERREESLRIQGTRNDYRSMNIVERLEAAYSEEQDVLFGSINALFDNNATRALLGQHGAGLYLFQVPIASGQEYRISSGYGHRDREATNIGGATSSLHRALDFAGMGEPLQLRPMREGYLRSIVFDPYFGLSVIMAHTNRQGHLVFSSGYGHLGAVDSNILRDLDYVAGDFPFRDNEAFFRRHPELRTVADPTSGDPRRRRPLMLSDFSNPEVVNQFNAAIQHDRERGYTNGLMLFGAGDVPPSIYLERDRLIGVEGATGSVTGPHLHALLMRERGEIVGLDTEALRRGRLLYNQDSVVNPFFDFNPSEVSDGRAPEHGLGAENTATAIGPRRS
ncbi:MAG: hypothetical protein J0M34_07700 [Alphaproteobacteria bacterium]|nr:hypothetical protein [Alphaproteobacteria bacterium]